MLWGNGGVVLCYRWKMLQRSWRLALLRDLEGFHSLLELPKTSVPSEMGNKDDCLLFLHLSASPRPPKRKSLLEFSLHRVITISLGFVVPSVASVPDL